MPPRDTLPAVHPSGIRDRIDPLERDSFDRALRDASTALASDYRAKAPTLLIAAGGVRQGLGLPPFEFFQLTRDLPVKRLYIRDVDQAWYQRGLPGVGNDVMAIAEFLQRQLREQHIERSVMIGNSMGGYAALLLGTLAGVDEVHAISPQTFLSPFRLIWHRDLRWWRQMRRVWFRPQTRASWDLRPILASSARNCHVHYSGSNRRDVAHAQHLAGIAGVSLHSYPEGGHQLVRNLRDSGALGDLLLRALAPHPSETGE